MRLTRAAAEARIHALARADAGEDADGLRVAARSLGFRNAAINYAALSREAAAGSDAARFSLWVLTSLFGVVGVDVRPGDPAHEDDAREYLSGACDLNGADFVDAVLDACGTLCLCPPSSGVLEEEWRAIGEALSDGNRLTLRFRGASAVAVRDAATRWLGGVGSLDAVPLDADPEDPSWLAGAVAAICSRYGDSAAGGSGPITIPRARAKRAVRDLSAVDSSIDGILDDIDCDVRTACGRLLEIAEVVRDVVELLGGSASEGVDDDA